jgi:hypothetical protein
MQQVHRKREVWAIERNVDGDYGQTTLRVELAFDNRKGQFRITQQITTEQVSRNDAINTAMLTQLNAMNREAFVKALEFLDEWNEANPDESDDQPELPFDESDRERGIREGATAWDGSPRIYSQPASNATQVGLPSEDGETVNGEEYLAQLRREAKNAKERERKAKKKQGELISDETK